MAGEAVIWFQGNVGKDPELTFTPKGDAVARVSVAVTKRKRDGEKWVNDETPSWYRVSIWRHLGEAVAENVRKGDAVIVAGRVELHEFMKDGVARVVPEVTADAFGIVPKGSSKKPIDEGNPW